MKSSGQSAIEYLTTYGWAILIVIIVGVALWQMGIFEAGESIAPGYSGFSVLVPIEWGVVSLPGGSCTIFASLSNGAGEDIEALDVSGEGECVPSSIGPGEIAVCREDMQSCGSPGGSFDVMLTVLYARAADGQQFQTAGALWGTIEEA